jgi:lactoylglutathione lyase
MSTPNPNYPVIELRVALTTSDYERLVKFYCDGLGIEPAQLWNNGQGRALILNMGHATLEIFDETQAQTIDQIEAGRRVSGQIRFALQVPDLKAATERLLAHGATLVHEPIITPWGDFNVRLQDPDGMQITLFQTLDDKEQGK